MKKRNILLIGGLLVFLSGILTFNKKNNIFIPKAEKEILANIEALTDNESDGGGTLPFECYDRYNAYSGGSLTWFRPCINNCDHIWAYNPKRKTICPGSK